MIQGSEETHILFPIAWTGRVLWLLYSPFPFVRLQHEWCSEGHTTGSSERYFQILCRKYALYNHTTGDQELFQCKVGPAKCLSFDISRRAFLSLSSPFHSFPLEEEEEEEETLFLSFPFR